MPELKLNGKTYELRFNLRALKRLETAAGVTVTDPGFGDWAGSVTGLSVLVWVGLLHQNPELTQDEVDDMIGLEDIGQIGEVLEQVFMGQVRSPNGQGEPMKLPIGSKPGRSRSTTSA